MVRGFELSYLLHVFKGENEYSVLGSDVEMGTVYLYLDDLREEGNAASSLVSLGIIAGQFPLARVPLVLLDL